jgi:energy-converting hydrogenase Eha subunit E
MNRGPEGNERLTSTVGLALIAMLGAEAATTLSLSTFLPVHIFLGLVLLPAVSLKLASTGWRAR